MLRWFLNRNAWDAQMNYVLLFILNNVYGSIITCFYTKRCFFALALLLCWLNMECYDVFCVRCCSFFMNIMAIARNKYERNGNGFCAFKQISPLDQSIRLHVLNRIDNQIPTTERLRLRKRWNGIQKDENISKIDKCTKNYAKP